MSTTPASEDVLGRHPRGAGRDQGARRRERRARDSTWSDLDVDSLDLVELVKALEDRYEVQIADADLKGIASGGRRDRASCRSSWASARAPGRDRAAAARPTSSSPAAASSRRSARAPTRSSTRCWPSASGIADGVGACTAFDPETAMTPKEARRADRFTQLAVAAATQAAAEAGLDGDGAVDPERLGVLIGTGVGGLMTLEAECRDVAGGRRPRGLAALRPDDDAQRRRRHDRDARSAPTGPASRVASACATGSHAIGEALRMIQRGEADVVVAGGTEAALTGLCLAAFKRMGALSREGVSRPFDARRDGFVMGEGAGVARARARRARRARAARRSTAAIAGYGASNDAFHITQPDEDGRGADAGDARGAGRRRAQRPATSATSTPTAPARRSTTGSRRHAVKQVFTARHAAARSARRSQRSATCSARPARSRRSPAWRRCAAACCRRRSNYERPRPRVRPRLRARGPARGAGAGAGAVQLVRLRRPERLPRGGGRREAACSAVFDVSRRGRDRAGRPRAAGAAVRPGHASGRSAAPSATACSRAAAASTGAPSTPGRRTASYKGGSLGVRAARRSPARSRAPTGLGVPVVGFPHSGGARLQEGVAALAAYAAIFRAQSLADVPQVSVIGGPCAGGAAYSPALGDLTIMAGDGARMFLTGPARRRAGDARAGHGPPSSAGRRSTHARRRAPRRPTTTCTPPTWSATRSRTCPRRRAARCRCTRRRTRCPATRRRRCRARPRQVYDVRDVAARLVDGGDLLELAPRWARNLVVGFARIDGRPVGVIANQPRHLGGRLDAAAVEKGAWFVDMCDRFGMPLVVLVDTPGFLPGVAQEQAGGLRHGAALLRAFARAATVPRVTVTLRQAYGGAHIVMNSPRPRARPDPRLARRPHRRHGRRGRRSSSCTAARSPRAPTPRAGRRLRRRALPVRDAAARGFVDEVVAPAETRERIAFALEAGSVTPAAAAARRSAADAQRDRGGDPRRRARGADRHRLRRR